MNRLTRLLKLWPMFLIALVIVAQGWSQEKVGESQISNLRSQREETKGPEAARDVPQNAKSEPGKKERDGAKADTPPRQLFKGKVVKVLDALKKRGVKAYPEELKDQVALETAKGELIPILPDWRGRAFYQDERLRDRDVELVGFRREGLPYLNVMSVYTFDDEGRRQYTDYWCDVCSIPMYEIKPCDCCQQEIRLRFQRQEVTELDSGKTAAEPKSK